MHAVIDIAKHQIDAARRDLQELVDACGGLGVLAFVIALEDQTGKLHYSVGGRFRRDPTAAHSAAGRLRDMLGGKLERGAAIRRSFV